MIDVTDLQRFAAIAIWIAVLWRGVIARRLSGLWWGALLLAMAITVQIPENLTLIRQAIGDSQALLLTQLIILAAGSLAAHWQIWTAHRTGYRPTHVLAALSTVAVAGLVITYLLVPSGALYGDSAGHPALITHLSIGHLSMLFNAIAFAIGTHQQARMLSPGRLRFAAGALRGSAAGAALWAALEILGDLAPDSLPAGLSAMVLTPALALFLVGMCLPLIGRTRYHRDVAYTNAQVADMWRWLTSTPTAAAEPDLFTQLIEIRDQMWLLQNHLSSDDQSAVANLTLRLGIIGHAGRTFEAAVCLEVALELRRAAAPRPAIPADLSALGGGQSPQQEARWLAQVAQTLDDDLVESAAAWVLHHRVRAGAL